MMIMATITLNNNSNGNNSNNNNNKNFVIKNAFYITWKPQWFYTSFYR